MCLIIARPKNADAIPQNYIKNAVMQNPDGFGIITKDASGQVQTVKDLRMNDCTAIIRDAEAVNAEFLAHFRFKTHGATNEINTHPFEIAPGEFLVHNGIIDIPTPAQGFSDTWHFVQGMKADKVAMKSDNLLNYFAKRDKMLRGSKLAVMGETLPMTIYNKAAGITDGGSWYSNEYSIRESYAMPSDKFEDDFYEACELLNDGTCTLADLATLNAEDLALICEAYSYDVADIIRAEMAVSDTIEGYWDRVAQAYK